MQTNVFQSSDLKFLITINSEGFDMDRDDYTIVLKRGNKEITFSKSQIVVDGTNHYLCVENTKVLELGTGDVYIVVYAEVPDSDFEDNMRSEVDKKFLCHIERV